MLPNCFLLKAIQYKQLSMFTICLNILVHLLQIYFYYSSQVSNLDRFCNISLNILHHCQSMLKICFNKKLIKLNIKQKYNKLFYINSSKTNIYNNYCNQTCNHSFAKL